MCSVIDSWLATEGSMVECCRMFGCMAVAFILIDVHVRNLAIAWDTFA